MNIFGTYAAITALLGSALIGGIFFAFSSFVMIALARLPSAEGINAMQSINVTVLTPSFLGVYMGTAVVSLIVFVLAIQNWDSPATLWFAAGALLYIVGTFLVTGLGNVPLNNQLAAVSASEWDSVGVWEHYLDRWTVLNTIRTVAALLAALMFTIGLLQQSS